MNGVWVNEDTRTVFEDESLLLPSIRLGDWVPAVTVIFDGDLDKWYKVSYTGGVQIVHFKRYLFKTK